MSGNGNFPARHVQPHLAPPELLHKKFRKFYLPSITVTHAQTTRIYARLLEEVSAHVATSNDMVHPGRHKNKNNDLVL